MRPENGFKFVGVLVIVQLLGTAAFWAGVAYVMYKLLQHFEVL